MRYQVLVVGEPMQDFVDYMSAIDYAARHVYLAPEKGIAALNALKKGANFSYRYGFKEVHFTVEKIVNENR